MQDKKYYSISEVVELLNIPSHQLRYLEKKLPELVIHQIRNRRYYTSNNIAYLKDYLAQNRLIDRQQFIARESTNQNNSHISKLACADEGLGVDPLPRPVAYSNADEDLSTGSLISLTKIEARKNSIDNLIKNFQNLALFIKQIQSHN